MSDKDWIGNSKSIYVTLGASSHSEVVREDDDYYATDPIALRLLIEECGVKFSPTVLEPCAGGGHLSEVLKEYGYNVISKDIKEHNYKLDGTWDFLTTDEKYDCDIVTNPPYKYAEDFILKGLDMIPENRSLYMFLKLQFLEGKSRRKSLYDNNYLSHIWVSTKRIKCAKNGDFDSIGSSAVCYAWMKFNKNNNDKATIEWFN
jgi:hypothetical protein